MSWPLSGRVGVCKQIAFHRSTPAYRGVPETYGCGALHAEPNGMSKLGGWDAMGRIRTRSSSRSYGRGSNARSNVLFAGEGDRSRPRREASRSSDAKSREADGKECSRTGFRYRLYEGSECKILGTELPWATFEP